jgi:hypothetical protein
MVHTGKLKIGSVMLVSFDFDLRGELRLVFDETAVAWVDHSLSAAVGGECLNRRITKNAPIAYGAVEWVGQTRVRQVGMAFLGFPCAVLGLVWTIAYIGDWGPWTASVAFLFLLGIWPLTLFYRGRRFLGIASATQIILIPMDRRKRQIRKILRLLRQVCPLLRQVCPPPSVHWELRSSLFANPLSEDTKQASDSTSVHDPAHHLGHSAFTNE